MKRWTKEEIEYLKTNYPFNLDKDLSSKLNRSMKSISYVAAKCHLKKDKEFYEKSRKKTAILFTKKVLEKKYFNENKSMRKIAKELKVSKTTIEHYFKKFKIRSRSHDEARKINPKKYAWAKGLTKADPRISKIAEGIKKSFNKKRINRIKKLESSYRKPLKEIIYNLYWNEKHSQKQIAEILCFDRGIIIKLMRKFNISKRPKYQYISSLKGAQHPMFGKTWETFFGKEESKKRKQESAERFRKLTLKRLQNNEFPFFDTEIERLMAKELIKRKVPFIKQFNVENKFVCDLAIPPLKIIIECDGDYWHANPKIYDRQNLTATQKKNIQRDKFKDNFLKKKGWTILRFFESEIKSNTSKCMNMIENTINSRI